MDLSALQECIDESHPKVFPDITAGEYLDERSKRNRLKKIMKLITEEISIRNFSA